MPGFDLDQSKEMAQRYLIFISLRERSPLLASRSKKRLGKLGLSSTTDKQKEAAWRVEFEALGEQFVLKNIKGAIYNEAKRQAAFSWLSEQVQLRDRRERNAELAWRVLFASMAAALVGIMATLIVLR